MASKLKFYVAEMKELEYPGALNTAVATWTIPAYGAKDARRKFKKLTGSNPHSLHVVPNTICRHWRAG